jgi:cation:H+ antiporter
LFQICFALGLIIFGAHIFVDSVVWLSNYLEVPSFVLALIIAPVATELPEKFNSIIWLDTGKDTLALGNITGAMVFQSSIVPAIGIILTAWDLTLGAMLSAILAILSALVVYIQTGRQRSLTPYMLLIGGIFYILFLGLVLLKVI